MLDVLEIFRIRFGVRPLLLFFAVFALLTLAGRLFHASQPRSLLFAGRTLAGAGILGLLGWVACAASYAGDPHFFDYAEPTMISVGWLFRAGQPVYHTVEAAERYALIYGPLSYIVHGVALSLFGPSLLVSKALGAAAGLASLPLTYTALRRHERAAPAVILTGVCALVLLVFRHYSFWTRPEPFQLLAVAASLLLADRASTIRSAAAVGVASGVLWDLKFTGPLYSLPILVLLHARVGRRGTYVAVVAGILTAAAPFLLFPNVSLANYVAWVRLSARTGLLLSTLRQNLEWAAFLLLPVVISYFACRPVSERDRGERATCIALAAGVIGVILAAAKPGAGPYHLLPFLPVIAYLTGRNTSRVSSAPAIDAAAPRAAIAFVAVAAMVAFAQQAQVITTMRARHAAGEIADVEAFARSHEGVIEIGYGSTEAASLVRPVLTFRNRSYLLDQPAIREHQLAGVEVPAATVDAIASCRVNYWLIPKAETPFSGVNGYRAVLLRPLYSEEFRRTFFARHARVGETTYYDVWQCSAGTAR